MYLHEHCCACKWLMWGMHCIGENRCSCSMTNSLWKSQVHGSLHHGTMTTAIGNWRATKSSLCGWLLTAYLNPPVYSTWKGPTNGSFFTSKLLHNAMASCWSWGFWHSPKANAYTLINFWALQVYMKSGDVWVDHTGLDGSWILVK